MQTIATSILWCQIFKKKKICQKVHYRISTYINLSNKILFSFFCSRLWERRGWSESPLPGKGKNGLLKTAADSKSNFVHLHVYMSDLFHLYGLIGLYFVIQNIFVFQFTYGSWYIFLPCSHINIFCTMSMLWIMIIRGYLYVYLDAGSIADYGKLVFEVLWKTRVGSGLCNNSVYPTYSSPHPRQETDIYLYGPSPKFWDLV